MLKRTWYKAYVAFFESFLSALGTQCSRRYVAISVLFPFEVLSWQGLCSFVTRTCPKLHRNTCHLISGTAFLMMHDKLTLRVMMSSVFFVLPLAWHR